MGGSPDFVGGIVSAVKRAVVRRVVGVIVVVVIGAVAAGVNWAKDRMTAPRPAAPVAKAASAPRKAPVTQPAAAPVVGKQADGAVAPISAKKAEKAPNAFASSSSAGAPVVVPANPTTAPAAGATLAHLDEHLTYQYNALGRRDPFQSLVEGAFVGADHGGDAPPDIGGVKVVGIVWGGADQFALAEDSRGNSFVLRKGDKIQNGFVEGLKRDGVIVNITADGQSQTVFIPLTKKGEQK
jgi:hypothetical protein